jgi:hypothetical protein
MLTQDEDYAAAFSFTTDRYDPNEIVASALAKMAVADLFETPAGERPAGARVDAHGPP